MSEIKVEHALTEDRLKALGVSGWPVWRRRYRNSRRVWPAPGRFWRMCASITGLDRAVIYAGKRGYAVGLRFFRRVRISPGLTLNLSKSGGSLSLGARGARYIRWGHGAGGLRWVCRARACSTRKHRPKLDGAGVNPREVGRLVVLPIPHRQYKTGWIWGSLSVW